MGKKIHSPQQVLVYFKTTKKQQTILDKKMREWKKQWRCLDLKKEKKKKSEDNKSKYQTKRKEFNPNSLILAEKEI